MLHIRIYIYILLQPHTFIIGGKKKKKNKETKSRLVWQNTFLLSLSLSLWHWGAKSVTKTYQLGHQPDQIMICMLLVRLMWKLPSSINEYDLSDHGNQLFSAWTNHLAHFFLQTLNCQSLFCGHIGWYFFFGLQIWLLSTGLLSPSTKDACQHSQCLQTSPWWCQLIVLHAVVQDCKKTQTLCNHVWNGTLIAKNQCRSCRVFVLLLNMCSVMLCCVRCTQIPENVCNSFFPFLSHFLIGVDFYMHTQ